ncbi:hypothetical protein [Synechocystis sp. PCC 6714]|uniref:hypothetical protein n=2 Tax=unclassified Synechocystis TaxID=2640012 RepID=UPI00130EA2B7|nr:hypothetical protein [Synechocystis sp. PCC 6714]
MPGSPGKTIIPGAPGKVLGGQFGASGVSIAGAIPALINPSKVGINRLLITGTAWGKGVGWGIMSSRLFSTKSLTLLNRESNKSPVNSPIASIMSSTIDLPSCLLTRIFLISAFPPQYPL